MESTWHERHCVYVQFNVSAVAAEIWFMFYRLLHKGFWLLYIQLHRAMRVLLQRPTELACSSVVVPMQLHIVGALGHSHPIMHFFFISRCGLVRPNPLGTSTTNWSAVPAPDDGRVWSSRWNENWQGKPKNSEKTCPSATLYTTNPS
jgi:hypothetical protein